MTKSIPLLLFTLIFAGFALAEEGHNHHAPIQGPHGGKVFEVGNIHVEFFVTPERLAEVRFYDESMTSLPTTGYQVEIISRASESSKRLKLVEKSNVLVSEKSLPEGEPYQVVIRIKLPSNAAFKNFRMIYNTKVCRQCHLQEYACICESGEGHDH